MATPSRLAARASFRQDYERAREELHRTAMELRTMLIRKRSGEVVIHDGRRYGATGKQIDVAIKDTWSFLQHKRRWYRQVRRLYWASGVRT